MNYKLIMLPNPILVSDEEKQIFDRVWNSYVEKILRVSEVFMPHGNKIIAGIEGLPKLDLSAIEEEIGWVDVEKLADEFFKGWSLSSRQSAYEMFRKVYHFTQSLNEKKFSEEELKDALFYALSIKSETCCTTNTKDSTVRSTIKSLSKPKEYNVEVEMEDIGNKDKVYNCSSKSEWIPKITNNTIKVTKILN